MTSTELIITVLGLAAICGVVSVTKHYLNTRSQDKAVDAQNQKEIAMTEQYTKRMAIFARAVTDHMDIQSRKS